MSEPESVQAAAALADRAAELAAAAERERRLPRPFIDELARAGLFRLCVPATVGGLEAPPAELVQAVEVLARGDGSAGWCVAIGATSGVPPGYPGDARSGGGFGSPG